MYEQSYTTLYVTNKTGSRYFVTSANYHGSSKEVNLFCFYLYVCTRFPFCTDNGPAMDTCLPYMK